VVRVSVRLRPSVAAARPLTTRSIRLFSSPRSCTATYMLTPESRMTVVKVAISFVLIAIRIV